MPECQGMHCTSHPGARSTTIANVRFYSSSCPFLCASQLFVPTDNLLFVFAPSTEQYHWQLTKTRPVEIQTKITRAAMKRFLCRRRRHTSQKSSNRSIKKRNVLPSTSTTSSTENGNTIIPFGLVCHVSRVNQSTISSSPIRPEPEVALLTPHISVTLWPTIPTSSLIISHPAVYLHFTQQRR